MIILRYHEIFFRLSAPRYPGMAAGAVSLRKSHDIVILSFCNIVKGQAKWLISIIHKNWISSLYKNGTFFQILEHNIVLLVVVLQRSSFGIHLKSAGEQSKLLSIICLKSACEATIIISLCVVFFLTQAPLNMEAGSEKCCLLLQNLERNIFRVGHKFTKCH